jgi:hypothetical protein
MRCGAGACASAVLAAAALLAAGLPACTTGTGKEEVQPRPELSADRELQTRRFEGISEEKLLAASVSVLQDLGFTIKVSNAEIGIATGVKDREAKAPEQRAAVIVLMILLTAAIGRPPPTGDMKEEQTVRVLVTTRPVSGSSDAHEVRVTFHRFLRQPLVVEAGSLRDPRLYEGFFELLSKAIFLEAHRL